MDEISTLLHISDQDFNQQTPNQTMKRPLLHVSQEVRATLAEVNQRKVGFIRKIFGAWKLGTIAELSEHGDEYHMGISRKIKRFHFEYDEI